MRIVVTGSEGSLMQAVIPHLISAGHEVHGVDSMVRHGLVERVREYEFTRGDLTDPDVVAEVMRGADGVVQAAARIYGVGGFHRFPADILSHDVNLHQNILWEAVKQGVGKVCYISSSMVYERCDIHPSPETAAADARIPATDYGLSKLVGERLSMAFQKQYGIGYSIFRPFNIITPLERAESEQGTSHVFADFIRSIVVDQKNPLPLIGDGEQVRCFTWIEDVGRLIGEMAFDSRSDNRVFNIGNPEPLTMKDLARLIHSTARDLGLIPKDAPDLEFETTQNFDDDVRLRVPDVSRAETELGWAPRVRVREAVSRCLATFLPQE